MTRCRASASNSGQNLGIESPSSQSPLEGRAHPGATSPGASEVPQLCNLTFAEVPVGRALVRPLREPRFTPGALTRTGDSHQGCGSSTPRPRFAVRWPRAESTPESCSGAPPRADSSARLGRMHRPDPRRRWIEHQRTVGLRPPWHERPWPRHDGAGSLQLQHNDGRRHQHRCDGQHRRDRAGHRYRHRKQYRRTSSPCTAPPVRHHPSPRCDPGP